MLYNLIQLFEQSNIAYLSFVFIFALMVGSFLNVVIYRLPKMLHNSWYLECREFLADELTQAPAKKIEPLTLSKPSSSCPHCGHHIRFYENIPVLSYLWLKGKCSNCKTPISLRYPSVELVTAILATIVAAHYGVTLQAVAVILLTFALVALTMIDYDHMILPDQITLSFLWFGLLLNINSMFVPLADAVIGATVGYLSLWSVFWLFKLLTGKEGMGFGDFKLFALFGAWLGWQHLAILILMASVVGALVGIMLMVIKQKDSQHAIPFGPYLAVAGWITLLWGDNIWHWYLGLIQ